MFQEAVKRLSSAFEVYPWVSELSGILPLSALIDFIEIPTKLHVLELTGYVPLWGWAITPSGSRLLLSKPKTMCGQPLTQDCYLDRYGNSPAFEALDGLYGDRYFVNNPETLRLLLAGAKITHIQNDHTNMNDRHLTPRIQNVEIIHFVRHKQNPLSESLAEPSSKEPLQVPPFRPLLSRIRTFNKPLRKTPSLYKVTSIVGWVLWVFTATASVFCGLWISFSFIVLLPITGTIVCLLFGYQPRKLLVDKKSEYVRLVVVTEHMNTSNWKIIMGESTIVNSLVNRPLERSGRHPPNTRTLILRNLLRICIVGQWAIALGASAMKYWDAYLICFWIAFPIFCQAYLISPCFCAKAWLEQQAGVHVERYTTQVSSRRSLLNLIVALNPDTFGVKDGETDYAQFAGSSMKWINPILAECENRSTWETATREAAEAFAGLQADSVRKSDVGNQWDHDSNFPSQVWNDKWRVFMRKPTGEQVEKYYWRRFIPEGIYLANKIKNESNIPPGKHVEQVERIVVKPLDTEKFIGF
ncbi:hypothetical protein FPOA_06819 [Fusarium poae]|jgi:hypothetical protein|uniref:Uncharacterized protein n=1 Tax=Fusarium poae TaxID=36050 RepID=A0A1B8AIZ0_FUSPO|nr:hypothetical protein FPOA_06819 [Fusarium poae]